MKIEIMSVGTWNGREYPSAELDQVVRNFSLLREQVKPPLKLGHNDEQATVKDGEPAIGWVTGLTRVGDKLLADVELTSLVVQRAIEQKMYRRVSSEFAEQVKLGEEQLGLVLIGLALLGADLPAVDDLADLQAYLPAATTNALAKAQRLTLIHQPQEVNMDPKKVEISTDELAALQAAAAEGPKLKLEMANLREKQRLELFASQRLSMNNVLEDHVKAKTLLPAVREKLDGMMSGQKETFIDRLQFSGDQVRDLLSLAAHPVPEASEAGEHKSAGELLNTAPGNEDPAIEVEKLATTLAFSQKIDYGKAVQLALAANPDLAQRYASSRLAFAQKGADDLAKAGGRR